MAEYKHILIVIKIIDSYVTYYYYILTCQVKYYLKWI